MRNWLFGAGVAAVLLTVSLLAQQAQQTPGAAPPPSPAQSAAPAHTEGGALYQTSLHFTNAGLEYWYAKEHGGLERLTGLPFSQMPCSGCHVASCDTCHVTRTADGKLSYTTPRGKAEDACAKCHDTDKEAQKLDVHAARGMLCMDCHAASEIHGDGTRQLSMQHPGVMRTSCVGCHKTSCTGNAVHAGRVDCTACHVRDLPSCYNCHVETRIQGKKSVSIPLNGLLFLVNHDGKVTLASLHTFEYRGQGLVTFAPSFPHQVMKQGRACDDCHATTAVRAAADASFTPVHWQNGQLDAMRGVIPVVEGAAWNLPLLDRVDGKWVPITPKAPTLTNFAGFCTPLTRAQLARLAEKH